MNKTEYKSCISQHVRETNIIVYLTDSEYVFL